MWAGTRHILIQAESLTFHVLFWDASVLSCSVTSMLFYSFLASAKEWLRIASGGRNEIAVKRWMSTKFSLCFRLWVQIPFFKTVQWMKCTNALICKVPPFITKFLSWFNDNKICRQPTTATSKISSVAFNKSFFSSFFWHFSFFFFICVLLSLNCYKYTGQKGMLKLLGKLRQIILSMACQLMTM